MASLKEMFWQDSVHKEWKFAYDDKIIGNELLHQEEITLTQGICEESELRFGSFIASEIKFRVSNVLEPLLGKVLTVSVELEHDFTNTARIGKFKVTSDVPTADRSWRDVTAYDSLEEIANSDVAEWYNTILPTDESTITMRIFRERFFEYVGVAQNNATLINDDMVIHKSVKTTELSGGTVLHAILEANGVFGKIDENGRFTYVTLPSINSQNVEEIDNTKYVSGTYEDFESQPITKLAIKMEDDDIGFSVGSGDNEYTIKDNFLLYGTTETVANKILSVISKAHYRPFTASVVGNPMVKIGTPVKIVTKNMTIESYLLSRKIKGLQALKDFYEARGTEKHDSSINSIQNQLIKARGKSVSVQADLDGFKVDIENYKDQISTHFNATDGMIGAEITRAKNEEERIDNRVTLTEQAFNVQIEEIYKELDGSVNLYETTEEPTLYNYPAYNFTSNIVCGVTALTEGLHFEYDEETYKKYLRAVANDITTGQSYRFRTKDGTWYWEVIADAEYTLLVNKITELNVEVGNISSEVSTTKTQLNDVSKIVEYQGTKITQTDTAIEREIKRAKDSEYELSVSITETADEVRTDARSYATTVKDEVLDQFGYEMLNYSTTEQMNTAISTSANGVITDIRKETEETYQRKTAMVNFYTKVETQQYVEETSETYDRTIKRYITNGYQTLDGMKDYSSTEEVSSMIRSSADNIMLAVNSKVGQDEVVNALNISTEGIAIKGNRLTIDSTNFKLSEDGRITCADATLSGDIKASSFVSEFNYMGYTQTIRMQSSLYPLSISDITGELLLSSDSVTVKVFGRTYFEAGATVLGSYINVNDVNTDKINGGMPITSLNIGGYIPESTLNIDGSFSSGAYGNYLAFGNSKGGGDNYYVPSTAWVKAYIKANCVMK